MSNINDILNNYGCKLLEDEIEQQDTQTDENGQQADQNIGPDGQPDVDPNNDPSINPDPTITDQKYQELDTVHRVRTINDLIKLVSVLDKIKKVKNYNFKQNSDINKLYLTLKDVINKIDIFSTEDIITFKETLLKNTSFSLKRIQGILKESENVNLLSKEEGFFLENFEDIFLSRYQSHYNTIISTIKNNISHIRELLYKLKNRLEKDRSLTFTCLKKHFGNKGSEFIVKDAIGLFHLLADEIEKDKLDEQIQLNNLNEEYFILPIRDTYIFEDRGKIGFSYSNKEDILSFNIDDSNIFLYAVLLRYFYLSRIFSEEKKYTQASKQLKYYKEIMDNIKFYFISNILNITFNINVDADIIITYLNKYRILKDDMSTFAHLDIDKEDEYIIARILAANRYITNANIFKADNLRFNKFDFDLICATVEDFIIDFTPDAHSIEYIPMGDTNFRLYENLLISLHTFNPLTFISSKLI